MGRTISLSIFLISTLICQGATADLLTLKILPIDRTKTKDIHIVLKNVEAEITGWDKDMVKIDRRENDKTGASDEYCSIKIDTNATNLSIIVKADYKRETTSFIGEDISIRINIVKPHKIKIFAPHHLLIDLISSSEGLTIHDYSGDVKLTSTSGDINVGNCQGQIALSSVSGDINVDGGRGEIEFNSISGDIAFSHYSNEVIKSRIKSVSGDILLKLDPESDLEIGCSTVSGDFNSEYPFLKKGKEVKVKLGSGRNLIDIETRSGDIIIQKNSGVI